MITLHVENDKNKKQNAVEYRKKSYHNFLLFAALPSQPACNYVLPQGMLVVGPSIERACSDNVGDLVCFCFVNISHFGKTPSLTYHKSSRSFKDTVRKLFN